MAWKPTCTPAASPAPGGLLVDRPSTLVRRVNEGLSFEVRGSHHDEEAIRETWEENVYRVWASDISERCGIVVDLGANIGAFTCYAAHLRPEARIHAYEPDPDNLALLERNLARNGLAGQVRLDDHALWGSSGLKRFVQNQSESHITSESVGISVVAITLAEVFQTNRLDHCDLLKMDIEGAEYSVLEEVDPELLSRIGYLVMELHPERPDRFHGLIARIGCCFEIVVDGDCEEGAQLCGRNRGWTREHGLH